MAGGSCKENAARKRIRAACVVRRQRPDQPGGGGVFGGGDFFLGSVGTRGLGAGSCWPGLADPFAGGNGSPKITRAFAGRFRTAVGQSVGAACLLAGTFGSQMRHMPAGGRALLGTLSAGRDCSCARRGAAKRLPIRTTDSPRRIRLLQSGSHRLPVTLRTNARRVPPPASRCPVTNPSMPTRY